MSNIIDFLERMGQDASLRYADDQQLDSTLSKMSIQQNDRAIVLLKDHAKLETLLGAQANVCCTIEPCTEH